MTDYGHDLLFGSFITPSAQRPDLVIASTREAERAGLDLATFQDHPYQPGFLDTWTLMSYLAAATERIRLAGNVLNLPLRQPVVLARSAASLDLLSGGRIELGLGAGAFWDAIAANGGRRLTPAQAVDALDEAIRIIRAVWATEQRGGVRVEGEYYRIAGAKRGPAPAHDIGIWVGAYKPRMLRLIGRVADGWLPSLPYLPNGAADLVDLNRRIDDAAAEAGREPAAVRRLLNISGRFARTGTGLLNGPPSQWIEELAGLALDHGVSGFILMADGDDKGDDDTGGGATLIQRFGQEVAPAVRALVTAERAEPGSARKPAGTGREHLTASPATASPATASPATGAGRRRVWDESTRPVAPRPPDRAGQPAPRRATAVGQHLIEVHDHLRRELDQLRAVLQQVRDGAMPASRARGVLNEMAMRQNNWALGAFCAAYCGLVTQHHGLEDRAVFPHLRRADAGLAAVIDRLEQEHGAIHEVVEEVDRALVHLVRNPDDFGPVQDAVDVLTDALLSHLAYEEEQLVEPLARHGFYAGQL
jgi:hypothetical protein